MTDPGLAAERTELARRRTVLPFLAVAALSLRAALDGSGPLHPWPAVLAVALAGLGAAVAPRGGPGRITLLVVLLAVPACLL